MALVDVVGPIGGAHHGTWNGVATSCHFATVFWAYHAEFGSAPALANVAKMGVATGVVRQMIAHGQKKRRSDPALITGSVYVFVRNGEPEHSCVALSNNQVGGYNQTNWFSSPGVAHGYSTHTVDHFVWTGTHSVRGNTGQQCSLVCVPEGVARACARHAAQG
jgi:hypothetical protein